MNTSYIKHILLIITAFIAVPLWAADNDTFQDENYEYWILSEDDATVAVFHWVKTYDEDVLEDIEIPQTVIHDGKTYTVIAIRANAFDSAFDHRKPIRSIKFPSTIKEIGPYAFRYCQTRRLELPEGLEIIGDGAFAHNHELSSISFPQSLKEIGQESFRDIYELSKIHLPREMKSIGMAAFLGVTKLMDLQMPEKLDYLGSYAFHDCWALNTVSLPSGLQALNDYTFGECSNLEEITFSEGIEYIGEWAFKNCTNLSKVRLPNSLKELGRYSFTFCSDLESIHIPDGVTYIGDAAFGWCDRLRSINIPQGVTDFNKHVIAHTAFQTFELPENIEMLGVACFMECGSLLGVTIPSSVRTISEYAFLDVPNLQYVRVKCAEPPAIYDNSFDRHDFTLYVPAGCKSAYQSAPDWSDFTDIREVEDTETVAPAYPDNSCRLTIRDSERGATILYVEKGSTPMVELKPADGKTIRQLLFNNQDVTQMLHSNNRFHTPAVTEDSTLEILYK